MRSPPEPTRRLAPAARWVWRLQQLGGWAVAVVAGMTLATQLEGLPAAALRWLPVAGLFAATLALPELRWRRWRWEVRPEAIDLRRGAITVRRTLLPMERVQHVDTTRGLLEQSFDLATVEVHTAAGSHTIPMLALADADELRDRIADLARTAADDEP